MKERFLYRQGLVVISAQILGSTKRKLPILLAVDTGSYISSISPSVLEQAGAKFTTDSVLLQGIGQKVSTHYAVVDSLYLLKEKIKQVKIAAHQLPDDYSIDGILGNDILHQFKLTIDYPNQIISIE